MACSCISTGSTNDELLLDSAMSSISRPLGSSTAATKPHIHKTPPHTATKHPCIKHSGVTSRDEMDQKEYKVHTLPVDKNYMIFLWLLRTVFFLNISGPYNPLEMPEAGNPIKTENWKRYFLNQISLLFFMISWSISENSWLFKYLNYTI